MIYQCLCTSFKRELFEGVHDFTSDVMKLALYTSSANLGPTTSAYTSEGEVTGANYIAGGSALTVNAPYANGVMVIVDFEDLEFANVTISDVVGALIYNSSKSNKSVAVLSFGPAQSRTGASFWVRFPATTETEALIRIA